jgi:hypothetical protein
VKVGECGPKDFVELSRAILVGRATRLRGVIEKVVSEELLEHCEIPAALHFFGVAPNHCFRSFAWIDTGHDSSPKGLRVRRFVGLGARAGGLAQKLQFPGAPA